MIIIGTKNEIENMIANSCPYNKLDDTCHDNCPACWNKAASIVVVRPEMIGRVKKDIDGVSFLERLKGGEESESMRYL